MNILYCHKCGFRIPPAELDAGRAIRIDEFHLHCANCKNQPAKTPSAPVLVAAKNAPVVLKTSGVHHPATRSHLHELHPPSGRALAPATPTPGRKPWLPIAAGVGAVMLLIGAFLLSSTSGGADKDKKDTRQADAAPTHVATGSGHGAATNTRASDPVAASRQPDPESQSDPAGPNPEKVAEDELTKVLKWQGIPAEDKQGRIKSLDAFLAVYGDSMVSTRARQIAADMKKELASSQTAIQSQSDTSTTTGSIITGPSFLGNTANDGVSAAATTPKPAESTPKIMNPPAPAKPVAVKAAATPARPPATAAKKTVPVVNEIVKAPDPVPAAPVKPEPDPVVVAIVDSVRKDLALQLQSSHFGPALDLLDKKLADPAVAPAKEFLSADRAALSEILNLRQLAMETLQGMNGKTIALKRGKSDISGVVSEDPLKTGFMLKVTGGSEMRIGPDQLEAQDIDAYAPPSAASERADDLRTRGIMFLFANNLAKARDYLKRAQDANAPNLQTYLDRIDSADTDELESRARLAWASAESQFNSKHWEPAQMAYAQFKINFGKTKTFASLESDFKDHAQKAEFAIHPVDTGLAAIYFRGKLFRDEDILTDRVDDTINFDWDHQGLPSGVPKEHFSARWAGFVKTPKAGHYTFALTIDDGGRLWIDGKPVIDDWNAHPAARRQGELDLDAGYHDIRIEYFNGTSSAVCKLAWALKDGFGETIVPEDALWHPSRKRK